VTEMAALDLTLDGLGDSWEELVSTGIELAQHMDLHRWAIGDVGCKVQTAYGQDSMGRFASEIGIANAQTFRDYTRVARRYELATRNAFSGSMITFTHFRAAMRTGDDAELWLSRAADEGWTVREMGRQIAAAIGARVPPVKLWEGEADTEKLQYSLYGAVLYLRGDDDFQWADLPSGVRVIVKVYAVEAE
jgi:uncharacterized protein YfiM (DUF2279 family)